MSNPDQPPRYRVIRMLVASLTSIVVLMLMLIAGLFWATRLYTGDEAAIREEYFPQLALNEALLSSVTDQQLALQGLIITGDASFLDSFNDARDRFLSTRDELRARAPLTTETAAMLDRQLTIIDDWHRDVAAPEAESAIARTLSPERQIGILDESTARLTEFRAQNHAFAAETRALIDQTTAALTSLRRIVFALLSLACIMGIAGVVTAGLKLTRALRSPLQELSEVVTAVDLGETGRRAPQLRVAELHHLGQGINRMLDTLEHKRAEASLQSARVATIVASANDGIVVIDADGAVTSINPAAARMLDSGSDDVGGRPAHELGLLTESEIRAQLQTVSGTDPRPIARRRGERVISAAISSLPSVDARDARPGLVLVLRDVTELARVDELKSEFISIVSHEMRTPLTAIKGFTDLILDGEAGEIGDTQREFLEIVQANSDRLVALINDMLDISRFESGHIALRLEPIELQTLVDRAISTLRPLLDDKQQRIQTEFADALPEVVADEARLIQVLTNLISNASKYTPDEGSITVGAEKLDSQMVISVSDTGVGIAPDALPHVFSKFYRADNPLSRDVRGTGLGLSITKSLVEMHGGRITIASRIGVGTTVRFTLPTTHTVPLDNAPPWPESATGTPLVLIVEPTADDEARWSGELPEDTAATARMRTSSVEAIAAEASLRRHAAIVARCGSDEGFPSCQELLDAFAGNPELARMPLVLVTDDVVPQSGIGIARLLPASASGVELAAALRSLLPTDQAYRPRRGHVLVAEDDPDLGATLRRTLVANGYEVALVRDGLAAVVRALEILPDAIILDVNMPKMGAIDVLPQLLSNPGTSEIPIIVMSGTTPDVGPHFLELGASDFFVKPLNLDTLLARLIELQRKDGHGEHRRDRG
ncbi:MAG TPA: ATP-binding protein [Thermomicrobiales bacterium]|nr:ATP-binding protein [Thermomicrobiales bacterium]